MPDSDLEGRLADLQAQADALAVDLAERNRINEQKVLESARAAEDVDPREWREAEDVAGLVA